MQKRSSRYETTKSYRLLNKPIKREALWLALSSQGPVYGTAADSVERTQRTFSSKGTALTWRPSSLKRDRTEQLGGPHNSSTNSTGVAQTRILMAEDNTTNVMV